MAKKKWNGFDPDKRINPDNFVISESGEVLARAEKFDTKLYEKALKEADTKLADMKEINKQANVKNCWFDNEEGLFHCLLLDGTEWTSPTGSVQDKWKRIPKKSDFIKKDSGKLQWSLMPFEELKDVVKVLMHGAEKYSPDNWKKCDNVVRYKDALMRHVIAYVSGEEIDSEFGLSHLAHAICNCLFLMWFDKHKYDKASE